ncbi:MAG: helix-turn-helix transcriptional regulator [Thermonemataceae bacterium]|nr:helix-turn-helix transcriptional regulator [Thermonemataceae bacterium]
MDTIKIKKARELRNYTQEYMAQQLGMTQQNYSKLEKGEISLSIERLEEVCKILDIRLEDLEKIDDKLVFQNNTFSFADGSSNINYADNQSFVNTIKLLYEELIKQLKEENLYLKNLINQMMEQK